MPPADEQTMPLSLVEIFQAREPEGLLVQYREHPDWTYQLHVDNLVVRSENDPELGSVPSYPSVCRFIAKGTDHRFS